MAFSALGRILLVSSACVVKLLFWMGVCVCGCPNSSSVRLMDTAVLALMNSAPSSASAADDITALIILQNVQYCPVVDGDFLCACHKHVAAGSAASFWFRQVGRIAVNCEFHVACSVSDDGIFL